MVGKSYRVARVRVGDLTISQEDSREMECAWCGEPLRCPGESLLEFAERMAHRLYVSYGINVLPAGFFCNSRCADEYYGYEFD